MVERCPPVRSTNGAARQATTFTVALSLGDAAGELQLEVTPGFLDQPAISTGQV
jgi:hypothetical protein